MIERIIENWLDKSSERSYQLPFSYLLIQQGFTIIHITRHCGMEHGKDILAVDRNGKAHAFQLKGTNGERLKLSEWQNGILNQITQLAITPIIHPSITSIEHHTSHLVINGGIEEEVQAAIFAYNEVWTKRGKPEYRIETIVKGQMLEWALSAKEQMIPSELKEFKSLLELYTEDGIGFLDKEKFSSLLYSVLADVKNKAESKRALSSCALLCSLALTNYEKQNNYMAIVEGWQVYISCICHFSEKNNLTIREYQNEVELAEQIILNRLQDLFDDMQGNSHLLLPEIAQDVYTYKCRVTLLLGYMGYLGIRIIGDENTNLTFEEIDLIIEQYKADISVWGESAIPYLINVYWFYKKHKQDRKAEYFLVVALDNLVNSMNSVDNSFTNVYMSAEDSLELIYKQTSTDEDILQHRSFEHVMEPALYLCVKEGLKESLQNNWKTLSHCIYIDYEFVDKEDVLSWRDKKGKEIIRYEKPYQEWESLKMLAGNTDQSKIPSSFTNYPSLIPLFLMVYPHRFRRNLVMWYNDNLTDLENIRQCH